MARKRYGQTIRMYDDIHRLASLVSAGYAVPIQDVYHAVSFDRLKALVQRVMDEEAGRKPKGTFGGVLMDEIGIEWKQPPRGSIATPTEPQAAPPATDPNRKPRGRRTRDG